MGRETMKRFFGWSLGFFVGRVLFVAGSITLLSFLQGRDFHFLQPYLYEVIRFIIGLIFFAGWAWAGYKLGSLEDGRYWKGALLFGLLVETPTLWNYFFNKPALVTGFSPFTQILTELNLDFQAAFFIFLALFIGTYLLAAACALKPKLIQTIVITLLVSFTFLFLTDLLPRIAATHSDQETVNKSISAFHQKLVEEKYQEAAIYTFNLQPDELKEYWVSIKINGEEDTKIERILLTPARRYYMLTEGDGDKYARRYLVEVQYFAPEGLLGKGQIFVQVDLSGAKIRLLKAM